MADQPAKPAQLQPDIGVQQQRVPAVDQRIEGDGGVGEAHEQDGRELRGGDHHLIDRMHAIGGQPVELLDAVMHGVKPPQEGDRVQQPVHPVEAEVGDQHHLDQLQPERLGGHRARRRRGDQPGAGGQHQGQHGQEGQADQHRVQGQIDQVAAPAGPSQALGSGSAEAAARARRRPPRTAGRLFQSNRLAAKAFRFNAYSSPTADAACRTSPPLKVVRSPSLFEHCSTASRTPTRLTGVAE